MTKIFHRRPKQPRRKKGKCSERPIRLPRVCGRKGRYVSSKRPVERERDRGEGGENTRTYRTPFVVRHVASCRRCKRWDERGARGIVGVGKLKAEAPRCRSGQPTPRCFAQKKRREGTKKKKREREKRRVGNRVAERKSTSSRECLRTLGETCTRVSRGRDRVSRFNTSTKRGGTRTKR